MSQLDEMLSNWDPNSKAPTKEDLLLFIKASLKQVGEINELYKNFFEGDNGASAKIPLVESKIQEITQAYSKIFPGGPSDTSVVDSLQTRIDDIRAYHAQLLTNPQSIKADIKDSQEKINAFYVELLGADGTEGNAKKIKDFYLKLTEPDGIDAETTRIYNEIVIKHQELFFSPEGEKSLIDNLDANIKKIDAYKKKIDTEITPEVEQARKYLQDVKNDIDTKRDDVSSLLSDATLRTLSEGYMESKCEYSKLKAKKYTKNWFGSIGTFLFNHVGRHFSSLVNYALFILPLVAVSLIFINEETAQIVLKSLASEGISPTVLELLYVKTIISIPLIWIAWYGQRNISQRKRLFEEYNHKLRTVQMYLLFNTSDKTYQLSNSNKDKLAELLLEAIAYNPAEHLGGGETIIDRVMERFHLQGLYKKLKTELVADINAPK